MADSLVYLLTWLPPLPAPGEPLPITLPEALAGLRQQGVRDLELLADVLEAESVLRDSLEEWVLNAPGSRVAPGNLPAAIRALFDEDQVASLTEGDWVDAVWLAWFRVLADTGRTIGSPLLKRWAAWEVALRRGLARGRRRDRDGLPPGAGDTVEEEAAGIDDVLAAWDAVRERGRAGKGLAASLEAEQLLERARLEHLRAGAAPYSFTLDELAAYLLALRLLDRKRRLDPERGLAILREAAAL